VVADAARLCYYACVMGGREFVMSASRGHSHAGHLAEKEGAEDYGSSVLVPSVIFVILLTWKRCSDQRYSCFDHGYGAG
jgi:hypothetical protein